MSEVVVVGGDWAGCSAVEELKGKRPDGNLAKMDMLIIPDNLAIGDAISYVQKQMQTEKGLSKKYTFSGSVYLERMIEKGLYTTDKKAIRERVKQMGLKDIFKKRLFCKSLMKEEKILIG